MVRPEGDVAFLWDDRPGKNIEHIRRHGLTPELWEQVCFAATRRQTDADDANLEVRRAVWPVASTGSSTRCWAV
jgi:hypothetical protein